LSGTLAIPAGLERPCGGAQIGDTWRVITALANRVLPARLKAILIAFRRSRTRTVRIADVRLRIRTLTPDGQTAAANLGGEFAGLSLLLPALEHDFIIDAGGYIGTAAIALSRMYPEAKIVSLEPAQSNYRLLLRNTRGFPNIVPLNRALAGKLRSATLRDRGTGEWGYTIVDEPADQPLAAATETVECVTIRGLMALHGKSGVDIVKLDIEGAEADVLLHSEDWIADVSLIIAELHDRIQPGCEEAFDRATRGMNQTTIGEKRIASRAL
jgi:FkbM family methyltransferase